MPTITVPGVGPVDRKYVIAAGVGVGGYVLYRYWQAGQNRAAATDLIDPQTGLPYSAENQPDTGYVNPNPQTSIDTTTGGTIKTNAEWVAAVTESLGNIGTDAAWVGAVLGKYLARQPLTSDEAATVRTAWAYRGKPPEGPDSFTLTTGGGSTPGGPGTPAPEGYFPGTWHVLKAGDTPASVAAFYGRTVDQLLSANQGKPWTAGTVIWVPHIPRS